MIRLIITIFALFLFPGGVFAGGSYSIEKDGLGFYLITDYDGSWEIEPDGSGLPVS